MSVHRILVSAFLLLGAVGWAPTASRAMAMTQDLASLKSAFAALDRETRPWPSTLSDLGASMSRLRNEAGIAALASALSHVETMRGVIEAGIDEGDAYELASFKYAKARLYLTLARSAMSRAHTAVVTVPEAPASFVEQLASLIASMDALLAADAMGEGSVP